MSERCRNCGKPRDTHQNLCRPCMIAVWDQRYRPPKCPRCGRPAVRLRRYFTCVSRRPYWRMACNFCPREEVMTCEFPGELSRPIRVKPTWLEFDHR